ncbi:helix-turn-helix transcriptional regulator [Bacteroides sp. 519]|uniref:helix-turn-helix transcriptional regulator n=1 Tax=Bacteroides sp. 519 TaxID=2302937 RepID=UPI0013D41E00|nr:helix-turn-helix transcriptional regulator [Bacteroides sp. 519]NDV57342.1 XRE family transcriptional regulator [Bacteroides sp. 519]
MANKEKFLSLVSSTNNETQEGICFRKENKAWLRESKNIAFKVLKTLKHQGLSQKDLAEQMGVSPQYVNKLVKGKENFTLETLVKLQSILDTPLLASYYEENSAKEKQHSVQIFSRTTSYQRIEYSEYNSLQKKVIGL